MASGDQGRRRSVDAGGQVVRPRTECRAGRRAPGADALARARSSSFRSRPGPPRSLPRPALGSGPDGRTPAPWGRRAARRWHRGPHRCISAASSAWPAGTRRSAPGPPEPGLGRLFTGLASVRPRAAPPPAPPACAARRSRSGGAPRHPAHGPLDDAHRRPRPAADEAVPRTPSPAGRRPPLHPADAQPLPGAAVGPDRHRLTLLEAVRPDPPLAGVARTARSGGQQPARSEGQPEQVAAGGVVDRRGRGRGCAGGGTPRCGGGGRAWPPPRPDRRSTAPPPGSRAARRAGPLPAAASGPRMVATKRRIASGSLSRTAKTPSSASSWTRPLRVQPLADLQGPLGAVGRLADVAPGGPPPGRRQRSAPGLASMAASQAGRWSMRGSTRSSPGVLGRRHRERAQRSRAPARRAGPGHRARRRRCTRYGGVRSSSQAAAATAQLGGDVAGEEAVEDAVALLVAPPQQPLAPLQVGGADGRRDLVEVVDDLGGERDEGRLRASRARGRRCRPPPPRPPWRPPGRPRGARRRGVRGRPGRRPVWASRSRSPAAGSAPVVEAPDQHPEGVPAGRDDGAVVGDGVEAAGEADLGGDPAGHPAGDGVGVGEQPGGDGRGKIGRLDQDRGARFGCHGQIVHLTQKDVVAHRPDGGCFGHSAPGASDSCYTTTSSSISNVPAGI